MNWAQYTLNTLFVNISYTYVLKIVLLRYSISILLFIILEKNVHFHITNFTLN